MKTSKKSAPVQLDLPVEEPSNTSGKRYSDNVLLKAMPSLDKLLLNHAVSEVEFDEETETWKLKAAKERVPTAKVTVETKDASIYTVLRDTNGVAYLRVAIDKQGNPQCVVNKGFSVDLITLPSYHAETMEVVAGADIKNCANRLLYPLNDNVIISQSAKSYLTHILENEEITMAKPAVAVPVKPNKFAKVDAAPAKATKTAATKAAPPVKASKAEATKAEAPAKAAPKAKATDAEKAERASKAAAQTVKFLKAAQEKELPKQAAVILDAVKSAGKSGTSVGELVAGLNGVLETKQPPAAIWAFYRKRLIEGGFISVA